MILSRSLKLSSILKAAGLSLGFLGISLTPALAQGLKAGQKAPIFTLPSAKAGKLSQFSLKDALKKGPVIVYFYPKAFTSGCSLQAQEFAKNSSLLAAKKVTIVGISGDDISVLKDFSTKDCGGKFSVASDRGLKTAEAFQAKMTVPMAARISFLVLKDGTIAYTHADPKAATHVPALINKVKALP